MVNRFFSLRALGLALLACWFCNAAPAATVAIDTYNMGKGEWIYVITSARSNCGVTTDQQLMDYLKNKGIKWVVVKCGDYGTWWPQFSSTLITAAHNSGLKIFGYQRCGGGSGLTNEINIGKQCLATAADGYVIDAEAEFEGEFSNATTMMTSLRASYPNAFIAHSPFVYIDYHTQFPYVEFGSYCNAVMPQCYWKEMSKTPTQMVTDLDAQYSKWYATWTSQGKGAAVKPIIPIAQGYNSVPSSEVTSFVNLLKNDATAANPFGPYQGVSFWSTQHHTSSVWTAIGSATIGGSNGIVVDNNATGYTSTGTWTQSSSAGYYGTLSRYATIGGAHTATWAPTLASAGTYDVYAWWVAGTNRATSVNYRVNHAGGTTNKYLNQTKGGGGWNLVGTYTFNAGSAGNIQLLAASSTGNSVVIADAIRFVYKGAPAGSDVIVDNTSAGFAASSNWWTGTSPGYYGTNYHTRGTAAVSDQAAWTANLSTSGTYKVYAWWSAGTNRAPAAPFTVLHAGGSTAVSVNQQINGGSWQLLGTFTMNAGNLQRVKLSCWTTTGYYVIADAIKLEKQ